MCENQKPRLALYGSLSQSSTNRWCVRCCEPQTRMLFCSAMVPNSISTVRTDQWAL